MRALGVAHGEHLHALAWNRDGRDVQPEHQVKSVGHEETFPVDVREREVLRQEVRRLGERVGERLRRAGQAARTVQLKVRYHDFRTITRSRTLAESTDFSADLVHTAIELLESVEIGDGVRLIGVSAQQLESADAIQRSLFPDEAGATPDGREQRGRLERSVDAVRERFGPDAVLAARRVRRPDRSVHDDAASEGEPT